MIFTDATNINRKSGVGKWRDLLFVTERIPLEGFRCLTALNAQIDIDTKKERGSGISATPGRVFIKR
jgi:hypothetical protein